MKTEVPRFEAVAGRLNEWRLSLPEPLVELLNEPPVKPESDAEADDENAPRAAPDWPRSTRRTQPQSEYDTPVDEGSLPWHPQPPHATPEEDADGPFDEDDAPRPRRNARAIPVDDADLPQ